jgi:hypothetical protein
MTMSDASCSFFYATPYGQVSEAPLNPTSVDVTWMQGSSASLYDWMIPTGLSNRSDVEMWLHIHAAHNVSASENEYPTESPLVLLSECRLRLPCSHYAGALVHRSATVLVKKGVTDEVRVVYACEGASMLSLHERVYQWETQRLAYARDRVLLGVSGTASPHIIHVVTEETTHAAAVIAVQSVQHAPLVFHVRTGLAVRGGLAPPVAVLHLQWKPARETQRQQVFKAGCLTESLVGMISYDADRHASSFHLATLPLPYLSSVMPSETHVVLEMTTPSLHDADDDLVGACGLAQRLTYTRCAFTRKSLQLWPSLVETTATFEAAVEGAASRTTVDSGTNVTWRLCGRQRYEVVVREQHEGGAPSWSVGPVVKTRSWPVSDTTGAAVSRGGSNVAVAPASCTRALVGENHRVHCRPQLHVSHRFIPVLVRAEAARRCFLETSTTHTAHPPCAALHTTLLSAQCRRMMSAWWQSPPFPPSRWVCVATRCSLSEWILLFLISSAFSLVIRLLLRCGVVRRLCRHMSS